MPTKLWRGLLAVVCLALLTVNGSSPAAAQTSVGIFETSVSIETLRGGGEAVNRVLVEAQEPGTLVPSFDDVIPSESLSWERVDFGTTPFSLEGRVATEPAVIRYDGGLVGTRAEFDVTLVVEGLDDAPRAGFVTYTFVPDSANVGDGIGVRQGVAARVRLGAWPADLANIPAQIDVSDLRLERDRSGITGFIDRLLPDLPRVLNRGPGEVRARTTNSGDVLVQADATLTLTRLPWIAAVPFVNPSGTTVITANDRARLLVPGESWTTAMATTAALSSGEEIDRLPWFGLVRIGVDSAARMGATTSEASATAVYLVAPWKEAVVLIGTLLALNYARRRWVRHRRNRANPDGGVNGLPRRSSNGDPGPGDTAAGQPAGGGNASQVSRSLRGAVK